ncbi:MAG: tetratricopeptide repeat protein [Jiangellales bacterium]
MSQPPLGPALHGAVDLSALRNRPTPGSAPAAGAAAPGQASPFVLDVTEATFEADVLVQSQTVPVVIDFWAEWCGPCKQLSPVLESLAAEYGGRFVLAKIDVDSNQRIAQAAQVQSIPMVVGVISGQVVPLFNGAYPEPQVRQYLDELIKVANANGVTGTAQAATPVEPEPVEEVIDPRWDAAADAIDRGDLDGAAAAFRSLLADMPGDPDATAGLAQVELMQRVTGVDPALIARADADPSDVDAACAAADADLAAGDLDAAFARMVEAVRLTSDDERTKAREHLIGLFGLVGDDPRVAKARVALANALF